MTVTKASTKQQAWMKRRQIKRILRILEVLPVSDQDGEILSEYLDSVLEDRCPTPEQQTAYDHWNGRLKTLDTAGLAKKVEAALARISLTAVVQAELTDALARLTAGLDMTPRQAGLWGAHVVSRK